jgi:hypothetical protein
VEVGEREGGEKRQVVKVKVREGSRRKSRRGKKVKEERGVEKSRKS